MTKNKEKVLVERRKEPRHTIPDASPLLWFLYCPRTGSRFDIKPLDISRRGLGFLINESIKPGLYVLEIGDKKIDIEVFYCQEHLGSRSLYRCGLFVKDSNQDLLKEIEHFGILGD